MATDALDRAGGRTCVTFTRGLDPAEVSTRYGAAPARFRLPDADAASDLPTGQLTAGTVSFLRSGRLGDWTSCVEEDGVIGSCPESLPVPVRSSDTAAAFGTHAQALAGVDECQADGDTPAPVQDLDQAVTSFHWLDVTGRTVGRRPPPSAR